MKHTKNRKRLTRGTDSGGEMTVMRQVSIPMNHTNLKLCFAALQHFAVSSCQWGIFPLAFIIFQIFHSSEIKN